jgi:hypothetical protein
MAKQSKAQKETVERVMHEFKHGELKIRGNGPKVKNPKQAIAIALHEAGASNQESPQKNKQNLRKTKAKERKGETARDGAEGKGSKGIRKNTGGAERSKSDLYAEAKKREIPGRSKMDKGQLQRALAK